MSSLPLGQPTNAVPWYGNRSIKPHLDKPPPQPTSRTMYKVSSFPNNQEPYPTMGFHGHPLQNFYPSRQSAPHYQPPEPSLPGVAYSPETSSAYWPHSARADAYSQPPPYASFQRVSPEAYSAPNPQSPSPHPLHAACLPYPASPFAAAHPYRHAAHDYKPMHSVTFGRSADIPADGSWSVQYPPPTPPTAPVHGDARPPCPHDICDRIRSSSVPAPPRRFMPHAVSGVGGCNCGDVGLGAACAGGGAANGYHCVALLLFAMVRGKAAVLLTRGVGETEYGMTAGTSTTKSSRTAGDCYLESALRIMQQDTRIPAKVAEGKVKFSTFRRLCSERTRGVPVVVGVVEEGDMKQFDAMARKAPGVSTRLFRVDGHSSWWRIAGVKETMPVSQTVRTTVAQIELEA